MSLLMNRFKENLGKHKDKTLAVEARTAYSSKTGIDVFDYRNGKMIQPDGEKPYLSLGLDEGTYMMFIGRSGGGKTSLLNLVNRFYRVDSGDILIDGVNINKITNKSLRKIIGQFLIQKKMEH